MPPFRRQFMQKQSVSHEGQTHRDGETIRVKSVEPSGRIEYDIHAILASANARKHFATLDRLAAAGRIPTPPRPKK